MKTRKHFELNNNEICYITSVWDIVEEVCRGKFVALNIYILEKNTENKLSKLPLNKQINKFNSKKGKERKKCR